MIWRLGGYDFDKEEDLSLQFIEADTFDEAIKKARKINKWYV